MPSQVQAHNAVIHVDFKAHWTVQTVVAWGSQNQTHLGQRAEQRHFGWHRLRGGAGHLGHGAGSGLGQPQDCLRTISGQPQGNYRTTSGQPQDNLNPSACSNPNRAWGPCANTDVAKQARAGQPQDCVSGLSKDCLKTTLGLSQDNLKAVSGQPQDCLRTASGQPQDCLRTTLGLSWGCPSPEPALRIAYLDFN